MKKFLSITLALALMFSLFAGCSKTETETTASGSSESGSEETTAAGNIRTDIIIADSTDASTMDPHNANDGYSARVFNNIYDSLVKQTADLDVEPCLAESWEYKSDTEIIFHLREGVKFHNGDELKASDVKFSIDRMVASPSVSSYFNKISEVTVIDDYTVSVKTSEPFAPLLFNLGGTYGSIVSEKAITEAGDDYDKNPIGTGPMKFKEWAANDHITLVRNEDYWKGTPKTTSITIRVIPEDSSRTIALQAGDVDMIDAVPAVDIDRVLEDENFTTVVQPSPSITYVSWNMTKAPYDNVKVRQALSYATNKQDIIDIVCEGKAIPINTLYSPLVNAYDETLDLYPYDLEKAKQMLIEAGYPDGFDMEILVSNEIRSRICQIIQQDYASIGVNMEISVVEFGTLVEMSTGEDYDAFLLGWSQAVDADNTMVFSFHSDNFGSKGNRARYSNPEFDEIVMQARVEMDETKRNELYKEAQRIVMEDSPWIPIMQAVNVAGMNKGVEGVVMYEHGARYYRNMVVVED